MCIFSNDPIGSKEKAIKRGLFHTPNSQCWRGSVSYLPIEIVSPDFFHESGTLLTMFFSFLNTSSHICDPLHNNSDVSCYCTQTSSLSLKQLTTKPCYEMTQLKTSSTTATKIFHGRQ